MMKTKLAMFNMTRDELIAEVNTTKQQNAALVEALKGTRKVVKNSLYEARECFDSDIYIQEMEKVLAKIKQALALVEGPGLFRPGTGDKDE